MRIYVKCFTSSVARRKCLMCGNSDEGDEGGSSPGGPANRKEQMPLLCRGRQCLATKPGDKEAHHLLSPSSQQPSLVGVVSSCWFAGWLGSWLEAAALVSSGGIRLAYF